MPSVPPTRYDKVPIKVAKVQLNAVDSNGNKGRTKSSFVRTLCADIVKARTMKELMEGLSTAVSAMSGLGIYKTVDVELDKSSKPLNPVVTIKAQEKGLMHGGVGLNMSSASYEPTMQAQLLLRNIMGNAETLSTNLEYGDADTQSGRASVTLNKPYAFGGKGGTAPWGSVAATADYSVRSFLSESSFIERSSGLLLSAQGDSKQSTVEYVGSWRDVFPMKRSSFFSGGNSNASGPSSSVIRSARPSLKSALRYTYQMDETDNKFVPTRGISLRCTTEVSGLGGDVRFARFENSGRVYRPISPNVSVGLGCLGGILMPFGFGDAAKVFGTPSLLNDRFFLGSGLAGSLKLRGFGASEVGPTDGGDGLGGDAYFTMGAHVSYSPPIDLFRNNGVRLQAFANCGNMGLLSDKGRAGVLERCEELIDPANLKVSAGVGVAAPTPVGRFELNLVRPLRGGPVDAPLLNFQWGIDVDFS